MVGLVLQSLLNLQELVHGHIPIKINNFPIQYLVLLLFLLLLTLSDLGLALNPPKYTFKGTWSTEYQLLMIFNTSSTLGR